MVELPGWAADDHLAAFAAYQASCRSAQCGEGDEQRPIRGACCTVCRKTLGLAPQDAQAARRFFEENFEPVRIARLGEAAGLLTGYFEPVVPARAFPAPSFTSRSTAGRPTSSPPAASRGRKHFRTRACASAAAMRRASWSRTTTAPPSRPARWMGKSLKSAGSRIRPTSSRFRSRARRASSSRTGHRCASTTTRITAILSPRSAMR